MDKPTPALPKTQRLFTSRAYPIHYLVIPKCGCTFVKNLLWSLEHEKPYPDPKRIHDEDAGFLRASALDLTPAQIEMRPHAFTVIRNPVDRFLSLYFDKVIGPGHQNFVNLRGVLADDHDLDLTADSPDAHRRNCHILIKWLEDNLNVPGKLENDAHWTPQHYRGNLMKTFNLKLLLLNDLNRHLTVLLQDILPDIAERLSALERNKSGGDARKRDVLDAPLRKKINVVYARDRRIFNRTRDAWDAMGDTPDPARIPRFRTIL
ncbi:sulfotransferase family 2 domain-containing protein [Litoreibacter roseus]|uniref:Sulfotransferase family protein n=1 Tax=Litoreibacter roseus TaxID=2601869 RepID=A0A6N6JC95_9RHOB|nr:sulfotransferase family 2 domain-containing protein [Litoreibacter roseus]GFE63941.1 hypothetical protein KIN_10150 [Litoreibacter roseus]